MNIKAFGRECYRSEIFFFEINGADQTQKLQEFVHLFTLT